MAKNNSQNTETQVENTDQAQAGAGQADPSTAATSAAAQAASGQNANVRSVKLVAPLSAVTDANNPLKLPVVGERPVGTVMARKDFIKHRWAIDRVGRGQITKDLNAMNTPENGGDGKKIPYQVVFAVIKKGTPGGPAGGDTAAPAAEGQAAA
jgi:hypothetical protein